MKAIAYAAVIVGAALPILFSRVYWLRVVCVLFLGFLAVVHCSFLLGEHRLVEASGVHHFGVSPGGQVPPDFHTALRMVQQLSQGEVLFVGLLFLGFAGLALFPYRAQK